FEHSHIKPIGPPVFVGQRPVCAMRVGGAVALGCADRWRFGRCPGGVFGCLGTVRAAADAKSGPGNGPSQGRIWSPCPISISVVHAFSCARRSRPEKPGGIEWLKRKLPFVGGDIQSNVLFRRSQIVILTARSRWLEGQRGPIMLPQRSYQAHR